MSESDQIGNKISEATFQAIREVLQKKENLDALAMESIIGGADGVHAIENYHKNEKQGTYAQAL